MRACGNSLLIVNERGSKIVVKNEKGRGDIGGMRREHRVDSGRETGYGC